MLAENEIIAAYRAQISTVNSGIFDAAFHNEFYVVFRHNERIFAFAERGNGYCKSCAVGTVNERRTAVVVTDIFNGYRFARVAVTVLLVSIHHTSVLHSAHGNAEIVSVGIRNRKIGKRSLYYGFGVICVPCYTPRTSGIRNGCFGSLEHFSHHGRLFAYLNRKGVRGNVVNYIRIFINGINIAFCRIRTIAKHVPMIRCHGYISVCNIFTASSNKSVEISACNGGRI